LDEAWPSDILDAARREGALVWLSAWQPRETEKVRSAFSERFPFIRLDGRCVSHPFALIEAQHAAGRGEVDTLGPVSGTTVAGMADRGYWASYVPENVRGLDPVFYDPAGRWYSTHSMGMAIAYSTALVPKAPKSYDDLADPKWRGQILLEDIRHWGTSAEWALGVHQKVGDAFFRGLAGQDIQWYREGAVTGALDALAQGRHAIAPWSVDYMVQLRIDSGEPLGWTNPLLLGRVPTNAILATAPHPNAARLFAEWLMSAEGQTLIGRENLGFPARPGLPCYMARFYPPGVRFHIKSPAEVARQKPALIAMYERVFFGSA
jgi:iron(III) transport system substrate-binding protein